MAFNANPAYGYVPGAPQGLQRWIGNQFVLSDLPPVPVLPPVTTAATVTPQDVATQAGAGMLAPQVLQGGTGGSGGPGGGPGGLGGASGGGQNTTTSGYQGVYAQSPVDLQSRFGDIGSTAGGLAGSLSGLPGIGTGLGFAGGMIDAGRINDTLAQYGMPGHVNPWGAGGAAALASIGVPFTDWDLAHLFGVPTAQQRLDDIIAAAPPGLYNDQGFGAIAANAPHSPGAPFGNTGWGPGMNPTTSQYPSSFLAREAALNIAANPDIFASGAKTGAPFDQGGWDTSLAGKGGAAPDSRGTAADKEAGATQAASDKAAAQADWGGGNFGGAADPSGGGGKGGGGQGSDRSGGDTSREGGEGAYKYRGGLIGPPPGRYQQGGRVRGLLGYDQGGQVPQGWQQPTSSLVDFPSRADIADAREISQGGALRALPGAELNEYGRPILRNPDNSGSTVRSIVVQDDRLNGGRPTMIPSIQEGRQLSFPQAIEYAVRSGERYPAFDSSREAVAASIANSRALGRGGPLPTDLPPITEMPDEMNDITGRYLEQRPIRGPVPGAYAAGGAVPQMPGDNITPQQFGLLRGINPPGPDDQIGALQTGEGVITKRAMGKGWAGLLAPINAGKIDPAQIKGLLAAKPRARR